MADRLTTSKVDPSKPRDVLGGRSADPLSKGIASTPVAQAPSRYISPLRQKRIIRRYYGEDHGLVRSH
jgi:hypothetical protein